MEQKTTMSVREMARMLGIKKTDSYWLLHKGKFETVQVNGKTRIVIDSFEEWYSWQIKYHKVDGPPPGEKLKALSYSVHEVAELLGGNEDHIYTIIKQGKLKTRMVDGWMRIDKAEFERWYNAQSHYRTPEDRERDRELEEKTMSMPEMASILGVSRDCVYSILDRNPSAFEVVVIAGRRRISRESFEAWFGSQTRYQRSAESDNHSSRQKGPELSVPEKIRAREKKIRVKLSGMSAKSTYSVQETADLLGITRNDVYALLRKGELQAEKYGHTIRIQNEEILAWLTRSLLQDESEG